MSEIEINKDDLNKAISTFGKKIENFETASDTFDRLGDNLDGQNSNFVNQMKASLEGFSKMNVKYLNKMVNKYKTNVKTVVDGFTDEENQLVNNLFYKDNPLYNRSDNDA